MKVETIRSTNKMVEEYPCLKQFNQKENSFIVLFISPKVGVVVNNRNTEDWKLGEIECYFRPECFTPIDSNVKVILSN